MDNRRAKNFNQTKLTIPTTLQKQKTKTMSIYWTIFKIIALQPCRPQCCFYFYNVCFFHSRPLSLSASFSSSLGFCPFSHLSCHLVPHPQLTEAIAHTFCTKTILCSRQKPPFNIRYPSRALNRNEPRRCWTQQDDEKEPKKKKKQQQIEKMVANKHQQKKGRLKERSKKKKTRDENQMLCIKFVFSVVWPIIF